MSEMAPGGRWFSLCSHISADQLVPLMLDRRDPVQWQKLIVYLAVYTSFAPELWGAM